MILDRITSDASEPVARRVFKVLRQAIVTMGFRPGQPLSEQEVADQLGVSRQPVREAFIKLRECGLVTVRPQRGTFVVKISAKQVMDARFVREAVELAVVRKAIEAAPVGVVGRLRDNLAAQTRAVEERRLETFMELDEAFHRAIALSVECDYAWRVVEEVKAQMDRVRYLSLPDATPLPRLLSQHRAIADAIEEGDAGRAEVAMRAHLREILTSLPTLEARFPDLFEGDGDGGAPRRAEGATSLPAA